METINSLDTEHQADLVVQRLTEYQSVLYTYIYSLTADSDRAWDVLQETNRVIWKNAKDYDDRREFLPWAQAFAFNQIRTARKRQQRDRLVFGDELSLNTISDHWQKHSLAVAGDKTVALKYCLEGLPIEKRELIDQFYVNGETLVDLASGIGKSANSVAVQLHRIRKQLADCIRARLNR